LPERRHEKKGLKIPSPLRERARVRVEVLEGERKFGMLDSLLR
jgi:hypothetical protein